MRYRLRLGGDQERAAAFARDAGNPAKIIRSDIKIISRYGRMAREDEAVSQIVTHLPTGEAR
ncbi:hypothetical protein ACVI1T_004436 [Rhizobium redzepovicii]